MGENQHIDTDTIITNLTAKNDELKEQIENLKLDIHELKQLQQLNEDISKMDEENARELQLENEKLVFTIGSLNQHVSELESRLEGQMNAEEIIATLTAKNLDLEEQNKNLRVDINQLEQLYQTDAEIIERQEETVKEWQLKNEEQMIAIASLRREQAELEGRAVDYERAIVKFRQKTADLNEEVQNMRDELATMRAREEEKARAAGAEISLLANANRTFSEIVEAELNATELRFAKKQISHMRSFLPDNFTKAGGDNDCLILCVLFPRLSTKALSLAQLLQQKYPPAPGGLRREHVTLSHRGEQWAHVRHFGYQLQQLHTVLHKFIAVFKNCSAERLSRLAVQQMEAGQRESRLEEYFKLVQQNRFDENTSIEQLEQIVKYFQRLFSSNLSTEQFNARDDLRNTLVQIKEGLGWIQFNGQRLRHYLLADSPMTATGGGSSSSSSGQTPSADPALLGSAHSSLMARSMTGSYASIGGGGGADAEFTAFLDRIGQLLTECEAMAMRALNRIPRENELIMTPELNERLLSAIAALEKCGRIVQQSCALATSQLSAVDSEGLPAQQMLEFVLSSVEKFVGQMDGHRRAHAQIFDSLESIKSVLDGLSEALENSSMEIPPSQKSQTNDGCFPPLLDRAHSRKQDAVEAEGLRWQVAKKDEELVRLQKALKARQQDIETIKIRLEMAEKQLKDNVAGGAFNAEIQRLQARCSELEEELRHQKDDSDQQLAHLQSQLNESEVERKKEHERTREFSKKALFANIMHQQQQAVGHQSCASQSQTAASTVSSPSTGIGTGDGAGENMDQVVAELRIAAQEKNQQDMLLKGTGSMGGPCALCVEREQTELGERAEFEQMMRQSDALVRDSNLLLRPTDPREMAKYRTAVDKINFRTESLRIRFHRFWRKYRPGQPMPTLLWPIPGGIAAQNGQNKLDNPQSVLAQWDKQLEQRERKLLGDNAGGQRAFAASA